MPTATSNRMSYLHGGSTSVAYNFNRYIGLVADFGGYDDSRLTFLSPAGNQTVRFQWECLHIYVRSAILLPRV